MFPEPSTLIALMPAFGNAASVVEGPDAAAETQIDRPKIARDNMMTPKLYRSSSEWSATSIEALHQDGFIEAPQERRVPSEPRLTPVTGHRGTLQKRPTGADQAQCL